MTTEDLRELRAAHRLLAELGVSSDLDFIGAFLGQRIGHGVVRHTFECMQDTSLVVKVAIPDRVDFQNQAEWCLWNAAQDTALEKWLAPCYTISRAGLVLIQRRAYPCPPELIPEKVPKVIQEDAHDDNWGVYEGRPVLMDYGRNAANTLATNAASTRLVNRED